MSQVFEITKEVFKGESGVKIEWSLELSPRTFQPRDHFLIWIMSHDRLEDIDTFDKFYTLLQKLQPPHNVMKLLNSSQSQTNAVGLRLTHFDINGRKCIYLDSENCTSKKRSIRAIKWHNQSVQEEVTYQSFLITNNKNLLVPLEHIHSSLREFAKELFLVTNNRKQFSYSYQYRNKKVNEVYFTFPWHPQLKTIIKSLPAHYQNYKNELLSIHGHRYFRHIGLSSSSLSFPKMTIYFSGHVDQRWPESFQQLQEQVNESSKNAHAFLDELTI